MSPIASQTVGVGVFHGEGYSGSGSPSRAPSRNTRTRSCGTPKSIAFNVSTGLTTMKPSSSNSTMRRSRMLEWPPTRIPGTFSITK